MKPIRSFLFVPGSRESRSRPDLGIAEFETRGYNQRDELVATARRKALMKRQSPAA